MYINYRHHLLLLGEIKPQNHQSPTAEIRNSIWKNPQILKKKAAMTTERAAAKGGVTDPAAEVGLGAGASAAMAEQMREKMARITTMNETCIIVAIFL